MIPKTIHYCWFGRNPKPKLAEKCIKSWKKYCPDYEIIEWNEDNFDIASAPLYVRQAYDAKKWAFVTDYVRLKIVYDNGGIYMDTDVEIIKPLDGFLNHNAFFGFEDEQHIATGLGFGAEKSYALLQKLMDDYLDISFIDENGEYDLMPCPQRNLRCFQDFGVRSNNQIQVINGCAFYPTDYFCPKDFHTNQIIITERTHTIHHFSGSWIDPTQRKNEEKWRRRQKWDKILRVPKRVAKEILGNTNYEKLRELLLRK